LLPEFNLLFLKKNDKLFKLNILKMKRFCLLLAFIPVMFYSCQHKMEVTGDDGLLFTNPLYHADFPDPDVVRVGDDFYMVTSSFPYSPGLPVYHSKNLVHWTQVGNVFSHQHSDYFDIPRHGEGVYAPSIRYNNGFYYIYYGDPDFGIVMTKAEHPEGPWTEPKLIAPGKGWIDPCPLWDEDGQAYLVKAWARSRAGINSILTLHRMNNEGDSLLDDGVLIFDGTVEHPTIEGPKMYKRNGYYYIFAPAGSVTMGWQTVLRSQNIYGPYEDRIVMKQGTSPFNGPHQGGFVELDSGEFWFLHFQDHGAYGRILHLNPMTWINDWPVIGIDKTGDGIGQPVERYRYPDTGKRPEFKAQKTSDDFDHDKLSPQWRWQANVRNEWYSLTERPGYLRLYAIPSPSDDFNVVHIPQVIGQRFPAEAFRVTTELDISGLKDGDMAGIAVLGNNSADMRIEKKDGETAIRFMVRVRANSGGIENELSTGTLSGDKVFLRITVREGALCTFHFSEDGENYTLMGTDFKATGLLWVGASVGLYSINNSKQNTSGGFVDIDRFYVDFEPRNKI
jgi:beta-xylosidase